jgi:dihydropteroate synthase
VNPTPPARADAARTPRADGSRLPFRHDPALVPAEGESFHLRSVGPVAGPNGTRAFLGVEVLIRRADHVAHSTVAGATLPAWRAALPAGTVARFDQLLDRVRAPLATPLVMGVVNVTPDSFSDGGDHGAPEAAIAHGLRLAEAGADILDVGGESTRPGAEPLEAREEIARAIPVVRGLAARGLRVSIDTRNAATMRAALEAGAAMINDVSALGHDPESMAVAAASDVPFVLMHARGDPRTMQANPIYDCAPIEIAETLEARVQACERAGIGRERLIVDPGIGFGKTVGHNLEIIARLGLLRGLGCPILFGASRKSFIARLSRGEPPKARLPGSLAAALMAIAEGAGIVRAHDVADTLQAIKVMNSVTNSVYRGMEDA